MTAFEKRCLGYSILCTFGALLYYAFSAFIPFIAGFCLAYLLRPIVIKAERFRIPPLVSALILTLLMYCILGTVSIVLIPSVKHLILFLFQNISLCKEEILQLMSTIFRKFRVPDQFAIWTEHALSEALSVTTLKLKEVMFYVLQSGWHVAKILGIIAMAPFLSFYIMKDWPTCIRTFISWIPVQYRKSALNGLQTIHLTLSAYLRGQAMVCITLCGYYGIALKCSGLKFGWLIGVLIGLFAFIPYISVFLGISVAFLIALLEFPMINLKILGFIFVVGYMLEALFLTPGFIGKRLGIHPVAVFMAIFLLGSIMGIVGVFLSAPLTAVVVACLRLLKKYYLESEFYKGRT